MNKLKESMRVFHGHPKVEESAATETLSDFVYKEEDPADLEQPTLPLMIRRNVRKGVLPTTKNQ